MNTVANRREIGSDESLPQQRIDPAIKDWVAMRLGEGSAIPDIIAGMVASGWHPRIAENIVADVRMLGMADAEDARAQEQVSQGMTAGPEPDVADGRNVFEIDGHRFKVAMTLEHPRVVVFEGFLSPEECTALMDLAAQRLARSETVDTASGESEVNAARTSDGMFFGLAETPLIERIEARIAALVRWPATHAEGLQVLRYRPGAQYKAHFDYFDPAQPGSKAVLARGGQRVGTLVMYLAAPERGGATTFPDSGLAVAPVPGTAVFFAYHQPLPSTGTLHGGAPVFEGEKWVATKWLREFEFH
jgi:prolyl 4-hydroxylase